MTDDLVFEVGKAGGVTSRLVQPPDAPAMLSPVVRARSAAAVAYDEKRRPQAVLLYRELLRVGDAGLSWKECWAVGEADADYAVGPVVVWLRSKGVDVRSTYDTVAGETRFYLSGFIPD